MRSYSAIRRGGVMGLPVALVMVAAAVAVGERGSGPLEPQPRSGDPLAQLDAASLELFELGRVQFERNITVEEGLGPTFNQTSCASCHNNPVGGHGTQTVTRFGRLDKKGGFDPLDALGGSLLQANANSDPCLETVPPEANITSLRVTLGSLGFGLIEAIDDSDLLAVRDGQDPSIRGIARTEPEARGDSENGNQWPDAFDFLIDVLKNR